MSQIKIQLSEVWDECPLAYRNMINHLTEPTSDHEWNEEYSDNIADIKRELRHSGARYCINSDTIIFPNERDYVNWLLKWE